MDRTRKRFSFVTFLKILVAFICLGGLGSPVGSEELGIVAVVDDEVITQAELNHALAPVYLQFQADSSPEALAEKHQEIRSIVLQQLIEEKLMLREARDPHPVEVSKGKIGVPVPITVSEAEVEEMIADTQARFASPQAFAEALVRQGLTLEDIQSRYRDQITIQKLIDREIRSKVSVSPAEVTTYYESRAKDFVIPPAVQVATILIKPKEALDLTQARELASNLRRQLDQGADFYELAQRYSDGPNAKMGGRVGFLEKGKSLKEIDQVIFNLKAGEVSVVIRTAAGFYIFKVESIRPSHQATLEEVQGAIQRQLLNEKSAAKYKEWIERLKANAYISIQ